MKYSSIIKILIILLLAELVSFLSWQFPSLGVLAWVIIVALAFAFSLVKLEIGLGVVLAELILGGKGYLFSLPFGRADLSIRLGIFLTVFLAWLITAIKTRKFWGNQYNFRWLWFGVGGIVIWAVIVGLLRHNGLKAVFFDANAFLFLALVPAFGRLKAKEQFYYLCNFVTAGLIVLAIKTGLSQALFNHLPSTSLTNYYKWIRDTGVGEITYIIGHLYRVFFQSQVYGLLGFFLGIGLAIAKPKYKWLWTVVAGLSIFVIIISLSRSFWLGGSVALAVGLFCILLWSTARLGFAKVILHSAIAFLVGYLMFMWVLNFPYLWGGGIMGGSLIKSRTEIQTESAASSRKELLPVMNKAIIKNPFLGSGLGTALTYKTKDPRINVAKNPQGTNYTTTAFELGYHALAVQFGLPLFFCFIWILISILKKGLILFRLENQNRAVIAGLLLTLVAIFTLNLTTPYLNHPLGLGIIILSMTAFALFDPRYAK
ncbi:MAG: O-antigen ligase family protein [Patescibacteria group bacterium]|jgi:hypothetical protein